MKVLYTFIILFFSMQSFAEGMKIRGVIKDIDTKKPIKDVNVVITFFKGFVFSDSTNANGEFEIITTAVVPEADYTIQLDVKNYWEMGGFVHVTKNCSRNFFMKAKIEDTTEQIIVKEKTVKTFKKDTTVILVGKPDSVKTILDGYATNNLVFLIDISASMNSPERMPLLKEAMKYLVNELRSTDKVAILTFSKTVQEVLPSTRVNDKNAINKVIDNLVFGSTSQGGIALDVAYKTALKNFIEKGNNRIILASDGLFTSGEKDYVKMQQLIESGLDKNISLSVFCFGKTTDYVNTKLKKLTTTGNGNYAVITNAEEAKMQMLQEAKAVKK